MELTSVCGVALGAAMVFTVIATAFAVNLPSAYNKCKKDEQTSEFVSLIKLRTHQSFQICYNKSSNSLYNRYCSWTQYRSCLPPTCSGRCSPLGRCRVVCSRDILLGGLKCTTTRIGAPVALPPRHSQAFLNPPTLVL